MHRLDELTKEARQIENDIDSKLVAFSRLGSSCIAKVQNYNKFAPVDYDLRREENTRSFEELDKELESLIANLDTINDKMADSLKATSDALQSLPPTSSLNQQHTIKRHREILRDYTQEYQQTRKNIINARNREDLLGSVYRDIAAREAESSTNNRSTTLLLEEQQSYKESDRLIDEHISAAQAIRGAMKFQRNVLQAAQQRIKSVSQKYPVIASLTNKINWKKRKDSLILGSVIGICLFLLIIYIF